MENKFYPENMTLEEVLEAMDELFAEIARYEQEKIENE